MLLFRELSARLPHNAIVTADSGSSANWYARQLKFHGDIRGSLSGNLATMGPGVPYGIGAKFGNPGRPVIVFAGDGAMQMNGLAELITVKTSIPCRGTVFRDREGPRGPPFGSWCRGNRKTSPAIGSANT
jgi:thiamine pyrophosphate-dependent acetolactate synthase large subunit-like protein